MIFDCFTFFNELDLLDIRLHVLSPYVDKFVISESDTTFQGDPKPFIYYNSRHLFANFDSKIIWVPVRMGPMTKAWTPWEREAMQRKAMRTRLMMEGVTTQPDDIILLGDVDEIPDLEAKVLNSTRLWKDLVGDGIVMVWVQDMTYYWVDLFAGQWRGTVAMKLGDVDRLLNGDFQLLRNQRGARSYLIYPGGWHFTYLGGVDAIKTKIQSFSHTEYKRAADEENIKDSIGERWKRGLDLFGRDIYQFRPLTVEEHNRLPGYLKVNRQRFSGFFRPHGEDQAIGGAV